MRLNGIQCDECEKRHLFRKDFTFPAMSIEILPPGWSLLHLAPPRGLDAHELLFCGDDCLLSYAQRAAEIGKTCSN